LKLPCEVYITYMFRCVLCGSVTTERYCIAGGNDMPMPSPESYGMQIVDGDVFCDTHKFDIKVIDPEEDPETAS